MEEHYREVQFGTYCKTCKYQDKKEWEEPCAECLDNPLNLDSIKPIKWKEQSKKQKIAKKVKAQEQERNMYPRVSDLK